jgi:hypothetical protein
MSALGSTKHDRPSGIPEPSTHAKLSPRGQKLCDWCNDGPPDFAQGKDWAELGQDGKPPCQNCLAKVAAGKKTPQALSPKQFMAQRKITKIPEKKFKAILAAMKRYDVERMRDFPRM